jgi:hypothetical protein
MPSTNTPLAEARAERAKLIERITWWDANRYSVLFPIALACFGSAYGAGWLLKTYAGAPERTDVFFALVALFSVGRYVDWRYSTVHLDRVDRTIERLEREQKVLVAAVGCHNVPRMLRTCDMSGLLSSLSNKIDVGICF